MTWTTRLRCELAGLAAIEAGTGPGILLLHGVGLRAEAWNRQIDALSPHYRIVAPDMPGHGQSPSPSREFTLADYTNAAAATAAARMDEPIMVAGHSMGAMIALDMAMRYPDRVCAVVALNGIFERTAQAAAAVRARAATLDGKSIPDPTGTLERWFGDDLSPERGACHDWLINADPVGYQMAYSAFAEGAGPSRDALAELSCPALFMTGSLEPNSTPHMSQAMAELAPQGRASVVDDAAHMMPMTHAGAVNAALLDFAQEVFA